MIEIRNCNKGSYLAKARIELRVEDTAAYGLWAFPVVNCRRRASVTSCAPCQLGSGQWLITATAILMSLRTKN